MGLENVPRCQHVKTNGTQCGSPALRRRRHCYFHDQVRSERARIAANASVQRRFDLPLLEDANAVQVALMKVIQMLGSGQMDHKTAGLMLYALQTASVNLRNTDFEIEEISEIVIDRDTVSATCINGPQWYEEDFDEEASEEDGEADEEEAEDEDENAIENEEEIEVTAKGEARLAKPEANAASSVKNSDKKEVKEANEINERRELNPEQVRKQVQSLARDWLIETLAQKPQ